MIKNGNLAEEDEYVDVIEDFNYYYESRNHRIYRTERYMVLQKRPDWWQVVNLAQKVFWVPCNYLRIVKLTTQQKKDSLRATYNKKSPKQQGPHTSVQPLRKDTSYSRVSSVPFSVSSSSNVDHSSVVRRGRDHAAAPLSKNEISGPSTNPHLEQQQQPPPLLQQQHSAPDGDSRQTTTKRQQKLTKDDISAPIFVSHVGHNNNISSHLSNNNDNLCQQQQLQQRASSFKPQSAARLNTGALGSSDSCGVAGSSLQSQQQSTPSNMSSRLSLYDGSGCSSDSLSDILEDGTQASSTRRKGVKSKSFDDGLSAATTTCEVVGDASNRKDENYGTNSEKASSAEQLNNRRRTADQSLFMNPLTYRNRSNSVDFKTWSKEHISGDIKTDLFDSKGGRSQGGGGGNSKDRILWRRSLVLEESSGSQRQQQYKPFLSNHDDLDASLVLDAPPDLPPKLNKNRRSCLESTTGNSGFGGRTYGAHNEPIDVRIGALQNLDHSSRRQSLGELDFLSSHQSQQHRLQQPLTAYDSQFSSANDLPHNDCSPYDAVLMQPVITGQQICSQSGSVDKHDGERTMTPTQGGSGGVSTTTARRETPPVLPRILCPPPQSSTYAALPMERSHTCIGTFVKSDTESISSDSGGSLLDPTKARDDASGGGKSELKRSFKEKSGVSARKGSLRGLFSKSSSKKGSKSQESPPSTLVDSNKSIKKLPKTPPSPPTLHSASCTRNLGEGWCEHWDPEYSCYTYYNESTQEKRLKPPRKLQQAAMTAPPEAFVPSRQQEFRAPASGQAPLPPFQSQTTLKPPTNPSGTGAAPSSDPQAYYYQHNIQGGSGSSGGAGGAGGPSGVGGGSQRCHTPLSMSMSSSVSSFLGGGGGGQHQPASIDSVSSSSSSSAGLGHSYHIDAGAGGSANTNIRVTGGGASGGVVHPYDPPTELNNLSSSNYSDDKNSYSNSSNNSSNGGGHTIISEVLNAASQCYHNQQHHHSSDNIISGSHQSGLVNIPRSRHPHPPDVGSYRDGPSQDSPLLHRQQQHHLPTSSAAPQISSIQGPSSSPSMQYRAAGSASCSTSTRQSPSISVTKSPPLMLPPRPPNSSAKPVLPDISTSPSAPSTPDTPDEAPPHRLFIDAVEESGEALRTALLGFKHPTGWRSRISRAKQTYENLNTGEKWVATTTEEGKIYFYNPMTNESLWQLPPLPKTALVRRSSGCDSEGEENLPSIGSYDAASPPPPPSPVSPSHDQTPNLEINNADIVRADSLHRTYFQKEGKRTRKNWTNVHARYYVKKTDRFLSGSRSLLLFAKGPEDSKINYNKCDIFDLRGQCKLSYDIDRSKSSQNNVLVLENCHRTVVLLRSSDRALIDEWFELLRRDEAVEATDPPDDAELETGSRKDDKKSRKALEKGREPSVEKLSQEHTTIREMLRGLIKRRPPADTLVKKGIFQDSVFGCSISELCAQEKTRIPLFVLRCINAIERTEDNLKADGLYRISGNGAQIQKIRFEVAKSNYQVLLDEKDVNNLTGALKLFFRELKEPLLPFNTYETFVEWSSVTRRGDRQWEPLQKAVKMLPPENLNTLKVLLEHLKRVCEYSVDNRMNFMNLAIVFGPCLLWPQDTTGRDLMTEAMVHNIVVEGLLTHFDHCFRSDKK